MSKKDREVYKFDGGEIWDWDPSDDDEEESTQDVIGYFPEEEVIDPWYDGPCSDCSGNEEYPNCTGSCDSYQDYICEQEEERRRALEEL